MEADIEYPKTLFNSHKDLPVLLESQKIENVQKFICCTEDKEKYLIDIRALKQALNHGLTFKKVHRVIKFNKKGCLKPYIDNNNDLRKEAKNEAGNDFFKLMNNSVFGKYWKI